MNGSYNTRAIAYNLLTKIVAKKAYPDITLTTYFEKNKNIKPVDIKLITEIVYGTLRWKGKMQFVLNLFVTHKVKSKKVETLLLLGIYQILFLDSVPDHASINETVKVAKIKFDVKIKNFINAILREVVRKREQILYPNRDKDFKSYLSICCSYPSWLIDKWICDYGSAQAEIVCENLNKNTERTIRINTNKIDREKFSNLISEHGPQKTKFSSAALKIKNQHDLLQSRYYKEGCFSVQDESSQIVSILLGPKPGDMVLDACSAPGTKTNHIAELMNNRGTIISSDISLNKLNLLNKDAERLGNKIVRTVCSDARSLTFSDNERFDRVLVDAPCSGLGTIKNNPDIKWNKSQEDIAQLSSMQLEILNNVCKYLKKGGTLVYSVCTIIKEENESVCELFLNDNRNFVLDSSIDKENKKINRLLDRNGYFSSLKYLDVMDGFFIAKFKKINDD